MELNITEHTLLDSLCGIDTSLSLLPLHMMLTYFSDVSPLLNLESAF